MTKPNGATIRDLRRRKGMTLEHLARRAGISEKTLRSLEKDNTNTPHPETIASIAKALSVEPESLFPSSSSVKDEKVDISPIIGSLVQVSSIPSEYISPLAYLVLRDDQQRSLSRYQIYNEQVTIGRSANNTIKLSNALVSENHAVISVIGTRLRIRDLGSTNGTCVNGNPVSGRVDIKYGDIISIGPYTLELYTSDAESSRFPIHETGVIPKKW